MCGIAGFLTVRPASPPPGILEAMTRAIAHRGPDAFGFHVDPHAHLGHRRLSIIDLSEAGRQPMYNEDNSLAIVYNGEIFNHAAIRPELEQKGHRYRSHCDTETILHAWEEWGAASLARYRGMFAFAVWDTRRRVLSCARDRLGIKPFYYWWDGRVFAFASEIKALLRHPEIAARFDDSQMAEYLSFGYTNGDRTLFSGIRKLMPGHWLSLDLSGPEPRLAIEPYWDVPAPVHEERSDEEWIAECRRRLEETVQMRLMSDVPLGMFLSGGVDSSAIAALMKRMCGGPVLSFAVGYSEQEYSELGYARRVAATIGTDHHEVVVSRDQFFGALPKLIWHEDEPISWPSSVSLYFVSQLASRQVKVVLTGEGSDEMFGGYHRYRFYEWNLAAMRYYSAVPGALRGALAGQIEKSPLLPAGLRRKLGHTFLARGGEIESLYLDNFYSGFSAPERSGMFRLPEADPYAGFLRYWKQSEGRPLLARLLHADMKTYLLELLMKQDQMSMACSIESRVPFLDHTFVEFSTRVPPHLKIRGRQGKYILKKAVEDLVPHDILYRPKMGFPTPLRSWLREPAAAPLLARLTRPGSLLAEYVERKPLEALLDRHQRGREDATDRIWRLLNFDIWSEVALGAKSAPDEEAPVLPAQS
jgi:asparagine synthase (glutamine-hydrolysing)